MNFSLIDLPTQEAALAFKDKIAQKYPLKETLLFGSRSRLKHHSQSDADVAINLSGSKGLFLENKLAMADLAVEILMDKGQCRFNCERTSHSYLNLSH
jgi:antitoxin ChpS